MKKNLLLKYMKGYKNSKNILFHNSMSHTIYMEFCKEFMCMQGFIEHGHFGQFSMSQTYCFKNGLWKKKKKNGLWREGRHCR